MKKDDEKDSDEFDDIFGKGKGNKDDGQSHFLNFFLLFTVTKLNYYYVILRQNW